MNRIDDTQEGPNIAGVSLALYLFVSLLSMMAGYEVGRAPDDVRNSVVVTLQSSITSPNKSSDDGRDDLFPILAPEPEAFILHPQIAQFPGDLSHRSACPRAFNARAPPVSLA